MTQVIDNFLDKKDFLELKNIIISNQFPWFYNDDVANPDDKNSNDFYFTHLLYDQNIQLPKQSFFYQQISDILLSKIDIFALKRVKANCYLRTDKVIHHQKHSDYTVPHKGFIYSLNTCNGFTVLEDDVKIQSIENRALFFDSTKKHNSTTCTDAKARFNINVNYI